MDWGSSACVFLADTAFDAMMVADLSKKLPSIITSHGTSEILNNLLTLILELCSSGKQLVTDCCHVWGIRVWFSLYRCHSKNIV